MSERSSDSISQAPTATVDPMQDPLIRGDWHAVARRQDLETTPQPVPIRLLEEDLLLWNAEGEWCCWADRCVHRGTALSLGTVKESTLICPYHGWVFDAQGRCIHIPAHPEQTPPRRACIPTYAVQERYGLIWVCLTEPQQQIPPFPEWGDPSFRPLSSRGYRVRACGTRAIENFLDVSHFPFVHEGILGDPAHAGIPDYPVQITPEGVLAENVQVYQPDPYGTGVGERVSYTYRALRPLTAYLRKDSAEQCVAILLTVTPHSEQESTLWMLMAMNYAHDTPAQELLDWQEAIVLQDIPILESQRPVQLPLDPQQELHLASDQSAIVYRRWLKALGLRFGVLP
ncbi:aromatic ring-hydroxylating oxygenase subunit alpha [Thermostichus vulcanus]|uniref:Aromatic ring-hydroxylating dioxygenase subunit alpha n=1 Tax=Thermostichus vulcanus str. 'Rupite' TaxID=2813851 RepID=A0ABT0CCZ2_THEVL|nr:aromatic ring-hydroxylating dioxygenase subunit alpha [Thermostichus vulcanus]MCJ2543599.1 aromatic ring-hydroxylating dioxygenase subunit alpha [Thermostichus vulcanus str. 'Rupite']